MERPPALSAATLAAALLLAGHPSADASLDAVSAASISVRVPAVTASTAVIEYFRDKYDYGTRILCFDPAPAAPRNNCVAKAAAGNQGSFSVSGLKPATGYNFRIEAVDPEDGGRPYNTTGTFTTYAATTLAPAPDRPETPGRAPRRFDAAGRAMPSEPAMAPSFGQPRRVR